ncbi:UNVERIFIED_CONTAM: hypothetical protein GTU68_009615, partial [Idotea baltica]|nr:hypothetical protein [Idotea baltica]
AWDAADEYLLKTLAEDAYSPQGKRNLVINDGFGALSLSLASQIDLETSSLTVLSDSFLSQQGIRRNFRENELDATLLELSSTLEWVEQKSVKQSKAQFDLVIIKIPKSLAELEQLLHIIQPHLGARTQVIAAGMTKSIHTSTLNLFESILGPTKTSLAVKKARLIFAEVDEALDVPKTLSPKTLLLDKTITTADREAKILSHGGVFSHAGLDRGTAFLLQHMQVPATPIDILDLGCGNGVIGTVAALRSTESRITFVDESFWAISSAQRSIEATLGWQAVSHHAFRVTDCVEGIPDQSQDLILNNPPFHQRGGQATHISRTMFSGSERVLRKGGWLWVVGNRHLGYQATLKRIFGNCQLVASNSKFVVLKARKN